ncbi:MAG: hypothetical protein ABL983_00085 [Nitrospira sp.]
MTTRPALPSQILADYCLAHLSQIHAVSGLTESDIRNAATLLRAAPDVLQNLLDSRDAVTYYHEHEGCPELLKKRRAALAHARDRTHSPQAS